MKLIHMWRHTKTESCNTNNCYHTHDYHSVYITIFWVTWKILEWRHTTVAFHEDNEVSR
jgi:hypothetical protein